MTNGQLMGQFFRPQQKSAVFVFYFKQNLNTYLMVSAGNLMVGTGILTTSMTVTLSAGHQRNNEQMTCQHITFGDVSGAGNGCSPGPRSPPLCLMTNKHTFGSILCTAKTFQFEAIVCKFRKQNLDTYLIVGDDVLINPSLVCGVKKAHSLMNYSGRKMQAK